MVVLDRAMESWEWMRRRWDEVDWHGFPVSGNEHLDKALRVVYFLHQIESIDAEGYARYGRDVIQGVFGMLLLACDREEGEGHGGDEV